MTPPQPNSIDPRAEIEAIFAFEQMVARGNEVQIPSRGMEEPRFAADTRQFIKPHIAEDTITELELIERAKAHAPTPEKTKYEHLEQIALISLYVNHLRDSALAGVRR